MKKNKRYAYPKLFSVVNFFFFLIFPVIFVILFRVLFFDIYFVPSKSMEKTVFPNDYVIVNKFRYGIKLPLHMRNLPVIGSFFKAPVDQYDLFKSVVSFGKIEREDIVVFKAIDDSDKFLIKRVIGLPSDTLRISNNSVFINSKKLLDKDTYAYNYSNNGTKDFQLINYGNKEFSALSKKIKERLKKNVQLKPNNNYFIFPKLKRDIWTRDNYGKLIVPKKGMIIALTNSNIAIYEKTISKFENIQIRTLNTKTYVFTKNYYFMMGDNRHNSIDSRNFGFVPEEYIQGKMILKI